MYALIYYIILIFFSWLQVDHTLGHKDLWSSVALLPSAYKAGCSQYLKIFVWVACHVNTRLEQKFMILGRSYSGPYMIPGRSYSGPYMIPGRSWQDHSR